MPACGASESQSQDESQTQGADFPKQWMGICQEKAETRRIHKRMGRLLSPSQYETLAYGNRQLAAQTDTHVYMESMETPEDKDKVPHTMRHQQI